MEMEEMEQQNSEQPESFHLGSSIGTVKEDSHSVHLGSSALTAESLSTTKQAFHNWVCDGGLEARRDGSSDYYQDSTWYAWLGYQAAATTNAELLDALRVAVGYLSPRVLGTGGDGDTRVLPILTAALAKASA
jgi:hypothetical protein